MPSRDKVSMAIAITCSPPPPLQKQCQRKEIDEIKEKKRRVDTYKIS